MFWAFIVLIQMLFDVFCSTFIRIMCDVFKRGKLFLIKWINEELCIGIVKLKLKSFVIIITLHMFTMQNIIHCVYVEDLYNFYSLFCHELKRKDEKEPL